MSILRLSDIYSPIREELEEAEALLHKSLKCAPFNSLSEIIHTVLKSGGKRLRPALVILSARSTANRLSKKDKLVEIATAIELIHIASLIHDDVIDHSRMRHSRPTINSKRGEDLSLVLGDYLYSVAFELISNCDNPDIIRCISTATKAMCEGELLQVCERDNLDLLKQKYIVIVKKKTASLFSASCQVGSLISGGALAFQNALKEYGMNFGVAFQIIDDYLDIVGEEKKLGKHPGQDMGVGEITLPVMNLLEMMPEPERSELRSLFLLKKDADTLEKIKNRLFCSGAVKRTKETASSFINLAKERIKILFRSPYKDSLFDLADFIMERGFNGSAW